MTDIKLIKDESAGLITIRDPMILPVGDTYYLTGTQPPYWKGDNEGVHLWSTKDLVHFTNHGVIVRRDDMPKDMWCRDFFWAPELFEGGDGYFYCTFNCRNVSEEAPFPHNVGIARAKEITGPYEILTREAPLFHMLETCNDATLFKDDDGTVFIGCCDWKNGLLLHRIDLSTLALGEMQVVIGKGAEGEWDHIGVEGQCIVKRHGIYFQWYSSWTHGYNAGLLTADSMDGPWVKSPSNPILRDNAIWRRAGHNHNFRGFDGKDYLIFHAQSENPQDQQCESMFIIPVEYKPDGSVELPIEM